MEFLYFLCLSKESTEEKTLIRLMKLVKINFTRTRKYIRFSRYFLSELTFY